MQILILSVSCPCEIPDRNTVLVARRSIAQAIVHDFYHEVSAYVEVIAVGESLTLGHGGRSELMALDHCTTLEDIDRDRALRLIVGESIAEC